MLNIKKINTILYFFTILKITTKKLKNKLKK